jgi:hypothetical protein
VNNGGFVYWLDGEWPPTLGNALLKLWGMHHSSNSVVDNKFEHARFVEEISEEENKIEKKYFSLLDDVKKFRNESERMVV